MCTVYTPCRNCFVFLCLAALDSKAPKAEDIEEEDDDEEGGDDVSLMLMELSS